MAKNKNLIALDDSAVVPTKNEISEAATHFIEKVEEGYINPLLAYGQITAIEQMLKESKERIKESAIDEAERYGEKLFTAFGMDVQVKETGVKYDYSENQRWRELKEVADIATAELKSHEDLLKRMGKCARSSSTTIAITLRK